MSILMKSATNHETRYLIELTASKSKHSSFSILISDTVSSVKRSAVKQQQKLTSMKTSITSMKMSQNKHNISQSSSWSNSIILDNIIMLKSESQAMRKLNHLAHQTFIVFLFNKKAAESVQLIYSDMRDTYEVYWQAEKKVWKLYKTWKNQILRAAST